MAEITQNALKGHRCFIAEENAESCVWAGVTLHNSTDHGGQRASKQLLEVSLVDDELWINLQRVLPVHR